MNTNLLFDSSDNHAGTCQAWYIPYNQVFLFPERKIIHTNLGDLAVLIGDYIPKPYCSFKKLNISNDTGKVDDKKLDLIDHNTYESEYGFMLSRINAETIGFQRVAPTSRFIVLVEENSGNLRSLGFKNFPALISSNASTGTASAQKSITFNVLSRQPGPAPIYMGGIFENTDMEYLSNYPMRYTMMLVSAYDGDGLPLTTDFYYLDKKVFSWHQEWNNLIVTRHQVVVHV